VTEFSK